MSAAAARVRVPRPTLRAADLAMPKPATVGPGEAAQLLGVSTSTLRSWADSGMLKVAARTPAGMRRYDRAEITALATPSSEADPAEAHRASQRAHLLRVAADMPEAVLLARCQDLAVRLGWRKYHTHRSDRSDPGFPDLVLVRRGVLVVRELKTERGKLTTDQQAWLDDLVAADVDAAVWRPLDLLEHRVERTLRGPR